MSDDQNNDKLMSQFIEKATPKLLEALTEQVTKQVEDSIGGLKANSEKLLDQVKAANAEREARDKADTEQFDQLKQLLAGKGDAVSIKDALQPESITITREQARDVNLYRRAKAAAEKNGTTVQIVAD